MKLITNLDDMLNDLDYLGTGRYVSLADLFNRLQEEKKEDCVFVDLIKTGHRGDNDAIFDFEGETECGCLLYGFSTTAS